MKILYQYILSCLCNTLKVFKNFQYLNVGMFVWKSVSIFEFWRSSTSICSHVYLILWQCLEIFQCLSVGTFAWRNVLIFESWRLSTSICCHCINHIVWVEEKNCIRFLWLIFLSADICPAASRVKKRLNVIEFETYRVSFYAL